MKRRKTKLIVIPDEGFVELVNCKPIDKKEVLVNNVKKLRRNNVLSFGGKKQ